MDMMDMMDLMDMMHIMDMITNQRRGHDVIFIASIDHFDLVIVENLKLMFGNTD